MLMIIDNGIKAKGKYFVPLICGRSAPDPIDGRIASFQMSDARRRDVHPPGKRRDSRRSHSESGRSFHSPD
jgi:hypothetical protein